VHQRTEEWTAKGAATMSDEEKIKKNKEEHRSYFRVNDVISVVANPLNLDKESRDEFNSTVSSSKAYTLKDRDYSSSQTTEMPAKQAGSENQRLYDMVTEINSKLDFIINHFMLDKEGLLSTDKKMVNISASGLKFNVSHPVKVDDIMEIKLLLPAYPPVVVFAYGKVTRAKKLDDGKYEVAIEYINMADDVRNELIQYTLSHQREELRRSRESREGE
jgi:hypothetical protein